MEKKRCNNFTSSEIDELLTLVEECKEVVECKKTDTVTNNMKEAEWRKIELKFNALCGTGRTAKMLRGKWDSLKKSIKKEYAEYKQSLYKTGGGLAKDLNLSSVGNRVLAVIGVGATGTISQFDSDMATPHMPIEESVILTDIENIESTTVPENYSDSPMQLVEQNCSWKSWTPQQLRQPKSKALQVLTVAALEDECGSSSREDLTTVEAKEESPHCTPVRCQTPKGLGDDKKRKRFQKVESIPTTIRRQRGNNAYEDLAKKKIEFINFQMALMKDESERKEKRLAEKHIIEMKILLKELQTKENM